MNLRRKLTEREINAKICLFRHIAKSNFKLTFYIECRDIIFATCFTKSILDKNWVTLVLIRGILFFLSTSRTLFSLKQTHLFHEQNFALDYFGCRHEQKSRDDRVKFAPEIVCALYFSRFCSRFLSVAILFFLCIFSSALNKKKNSKICRLTTNQFYGSRDDSFCREKFSEIIMWFDGTINNCKV